ncbi:hypothetical protein [Catellatospora vulcania]|uniref:hypothetical protein n=1 Tax=Catellatospora vulcania TaxID=1460450 RepID=UPI0012D4B970|nr:hypothetical protein [Catellatospora vulcania]
MGLTVAEAKKRIDDIMARYQAVSTGSTRGLTLSLSPGKLYEAWVLSTILERLRTDEGYDVVLIGSDKVRLRSSGGPVDRSFAHFELRRGGVALLEVWTDIEFLSFSHQQRGARMPPQRGDRHELDIVILPAGTAAGYPPHDVIKMAVECKNTAFEKHMARAALGVRRELSLLRPSQQTAFSTWPRSVVPAEPASVFSVYSTDGTVTEYDQAGQIFGVDFIHEPM